MTFHNFIIRTLIKLLDRYVNVSLPKHDNKVREWLIMCWNEEGFRQYFRKRDYELLKGLGGNPSKDNYQTLLGRRMELLELAKTAKDANEKHKNESPNKE